ncbi:MAG TPA: NAD(P)/FAD-dependent oxidoreductase [Thermoanaerobaculia bacterium]|jgi:monoamine oxidase|nr:NAD(P)/FAD-dependent oxidoreductase [Thermoanaerobaculia bacterium]
MQPIDPERWEKAQLLARVLLRVGPQNEDLTKKYLEILVDDGLPPAAKPQHVLIIGAGIAGLTASWLLARAGHRVTLVEANRNRVGGRIKTFREFKDPAQYAEAGAMRLPDFHPLVLGLVDRLGLERRLFYNVDVDPSSGSTSGPVPPVIYKPFDGSGTWRNGPDQPGFKSPDKLSRTWMRTNGCQVRRADYARDPSAINGGFEIESWRKAKTASDMINAALDPVRDYYSVIDPQSGQRVNKPFPEWVAGWARLIYDLDRFSMWGFLKEVAGLSDNTIEAIGTLENLTSRLPLAFFHSFLGRSDINPGATYWEIAGGSDRLTDVLKEHVLETGNVDLVMGQRMIRLEWRDGEGVWIRTAAEEDSTRIADYSADRAIVTIPFSSLRHVLVHPGFSYKKRRAIIELHYDSATKVLLEFDRRWWEFSEEDWRRELAADVAAPREAPAGGEAAETREVLDALRPPAPNPGVAHQDADHFFGGGSVTDNPNRFIYYPSHPMEGSPGGVILASYSWADDAARWDSLDDAERYAYALRGLVAIHGERIVKFYSGRGATQSWLRNPYAFGEAAVFTPWQLTQFHLDIPTPEGPVHFAGEHTSLKHAWIEGSLESAVRAALEVHESAGGEGDE